MQIKCPGCGAVASAEAWADNGAVRDLLAAVAKLPSPLPLTVLSYLAFFRPARSAMSWKKALRLVNEVAALAAAGFVHVQGRVDRPCSPVIWVKAMEQMEEQRHGLTLPLSSHNYLCKIAWGLADEADAAGEKARDQQNLSRSIPADRRADNHESDGPVDVARILADFKKNRPAYR